jgi:predicted transglutaminase-like cysteine proteinase
LRFTNFWLPLSVLAALSFAPREAPAGAAVPHPAAAQKATGLHNVSSFHRRKRPLSISSILARRAALGAPLDGPNHSLFNTIETRSSELVAFKKWTGAVAKMAQEQTDVKAFAARFKDWIVFLDTLKGKDRMTQFVEVNKFMNRSQYILDMKNWGVKDYWESPGEFLARFGDCEDYSIAKYMALKYLGFDPEKMRIVAVRDMNLRIGHAILAVYYDNKILILDNQIKVVADSRRIHHYVPIYSINEKYWWRHRAA